MKLFILFETHIQDYVYRHIHTNIYYALDARVRTVTYLLSKYNVFPLQLYFFKQILSLIKFYF